MKKVISILFCLLMVISPVFSQDSLAEFIGDVLLFENLLVNYDVYPFADGDYIKYDGLSADLTREKDWRYELETSALYFTDKQTIGNETRLDGIFFHFFGPELENRICYNRATGQMTGDLKLGVILNIFQFNFLSMALAFQYDHLYGNEDLDGLNFGLIFRSYIAHTYLLECRLNFSDFDLASENNAALDTDSVFESHFELGTMIAPHLEAFGAFKYIQDNIRLLENNALIFGLKVHY